MRKKGKKREPKKCEICGRKLLDPFNQKHIDSKVHQAAIRRRKAKPSSTTQPSIPSPAVALPTSAAGLEQRVNLLENQIQFIMKKLSAIDVKLASNTQMTADLSDLSPIKGYIKRLIPKGRSMTIDEIALSDGLRNYEWLVIEKALIDLIDDEIFDASESNSSRKIAGNIGRIMRR